MFCYLQYASGLPADGNQCGDKRNEQRFIAFIVWHIEEDAVFVWVDFMPHLESDLEGSQLLGTYRTDGQFGFAEILSVNV